MSGEQQLAMTDGPRTQQAEMAPEAAQNLYQAMQPPAGAAPAGAAPAPEAPAAPAVDTSPQGLLQAMQQVNGGVAPGEEPQQAPAGAAAPPDDVSMMTKILARVATTPTGQAEILKAHDPRVKTRVKDDKGEYQLPGSTDWHPIKPDWFNSTKDFLTNVGGLIPDATEMAGQLGGAALGAVGGATLGAIQGAPGGIPGIAGGAALGAIPGEMAGSAAAAVATLHARQAISQILGASPEQLTNMDNAWAAGLGAGGAAAGMALRRPIQVVSDLLKDTVMNGKTALGVGISKLHLELEAAYGDLSGKSAPALKEVGNQAASALEAIDTRYGQNVGIARTMAAELSGNTKLVPQRYMDQLTATLNKDYATSLEPKATIQQPDRWQMTPRSVGKGEAPRTLSPELVSTWNQIKNNEGMTMGEMSNHLADVKLKAHFDTIAPTQQETMYRSLYHALTQDESDAVANAVQGTPAQDFATSAKANFAQNIDALRAIQKGVDESPEGYAKALTADSLTAQRARDLFTNPLNQLATGGPTDGMTAWDAIKSSWLSRHFDAVRDETTGIIDIPKLAKRLGKDDSAVAEVMLGKDYKPQLDRMARAMDQTNWQALTKNPDTIPHQGLIRSVTKFFMSGFSPIYGAHVMSDLSGLYHGASNNQILRLIQSEGINKFAEEATTIQERALQMRASKAIDTIMNATNTHVNLGAGMKVQIPIESAMVPVLLKGAPGSQAPGATPAQAQQSQSDAYNAYKANQALRFQQLQQEVMRKTLEGQAQQTSGAPKFVGVHGNRGLH